MKPNLVQEGLKYGAICGLILVLITYVSWAMGIDAFITVSFWSRLIPYMLVIILVAGLQLRKKNGGTLAFADALKFTFLCYVVAELMYAVSNYVLYNLIDKGLAQQVMDITAVKTRQMMEKLGAPDDKIEESIKNAKNGNMMSVGKILVGTGIYLIWDFILSLLLSLIIRKEEKFSD